MLTLRQRALAMLVVLAALLGGCAVAQYSNGPNSAELEARQYSFGVTGSSTGYVLHIGGRESDVFTPLTEEGRPVTLNRIAATFDLNGSKLAVIEANSGQCPFTYIFVLMRGNATSGSKQGACGQHYDFAQRGDTVVATEQANPDPATFTYQNGTATPPRRQSEIQRQIAADQAAAAERARMAAQAAQQRAQAAQQAAAKQAETDRQAAVDKADADAAEAQARVDDERQARAQILAAAASEILHRNDNVDLDVEARTGGLFPAIIILSRDDHVVKVFRVVINRRRDLPECVVEKDYFGTYFVRQPLALGASIGVPVSDACNQPVVIEIDTDRGKWQNR